MHTVYMTTTTATAPKTFTVGEFTYDASTKAVSGPASFMRSDDYASWRSRFQSGQDTVFNFGASHIGESGYAANFETAMLVSLQTCYAGWHGRQTFLRTLER